MFQNLGVVARLTSFKLVRVRPFYLRDQSLFLRCHILSLELRSKICFLKYTFRLVDIMHELTNSMQRFACVVLFDALAFN